MMLANEFMEIFQSGLGEMDKVQIGGHAVDLPVSVQHFLKERDLAVVVGIRDEHVHIRGQQTVGLIVHGRVGCQDCLGKRLQVFVLSPSIMGDGKHGAGGNGLPFGRGHLAKA